MLDDEAISDLNQCYLGRDGPTNVIAFPMRAGPFGDSQLEILGDVVVSVETAAREAEQAGRSVEDHLDALLIHGILHLFGYDHETGEEDAWRMDEKAEQLWAILHPGRSL